MIYTSINNKKIKELKKLSQKKYRDLTNTFLVETDNIIKEAYETNHLKELFALENKKINIKTNIVNEKILKYLSNLKTPLDMIGLCEKPKEKEIKGNVIALDNIQDPGNLGTIIRTCYALNIDTILISNTSADPYSPKVVRASEGMIFKENIIVCNLKEKIKELKKKQYKIYGTDVNNGKVLKNVSKSEKFVIIMGNEGNGISESIKKLVDENIYIPINKNCESLNVAIATSIILYEMGR